MNNYLKNFRIEEILIGMILFSLPLSFGVNSFAIIVATLFFLYKTINKAGYKNLKLYYFSFSFFIVQLCSFLLSSNQKEAGLKLILYSSFFMLPFCFSNLTDRKIKLDENKIFKFLLYGTTIVLIYGLIRFTYDVLFLNQRYDYGRAVALILKYIPHHIYMSIFILNSIYTTLVSKIENKIKKDIYLLPFLYLFLILLGSRMAIFLSIVVLPIFLMKKIINKKISKKGILIGSVFFILVLFLGFSNDFVRDKILYTYYDLMNITTKEKPFFGVSFRRQIWATVIDLIQHSSFFGYGIGDVQEILNNSYKNNDLKGLNTHNQYFQFILNYGIIISLILFVLTFKLIKQCFVNKKSNLLFSWLIILFFCLTESILNRQWGVVLFAFVLNYSIYSNNFLKMKKNKIINVVK
jgi:O-antigen ligase